MDSSFNINIDRICCYGALTSFEKLLIIFLLHKKWLSADEFSYLPKKKVIAARLNSDPSAVSRGLKKAKHLHLINENENGEAIFNSSSWAKNCAGLYFGDKVYLEEIEE